MQVCQSFHRKGSLGNNSSHTHTHTLSYSCTHPVTLSLFNLHHETDPRQPETTTRTRQTAFTMAWYHQEKNLSDTSQWESVSVCYIVMDVIKSRCMQSEIRWSCGKECVWVVMCSPGRPCLYAEMDSVNCSSRLWHFNFFENFNELARPH